jgi:ATP-dependent Clp protease ATP-binding subunit ClpC
MRLSLRRFTDRAVKVMQVARQEAAQRHQAAVTPEHVLLALALVELGPWQAVLERLGLNLSMEQATLAALAAEGRQGEPGQEPAVSAEVEELLNAAVAQARGLGHRWVGTEHLTLALVDAGSTPAAEFLRRRGISSDSLRDAVRAAGSVTWRSRRSAAP